MTKKNRRAKAGQRQAGKGGLPAGAKPSRPAGPKNPFSVPRILLMALAFISCCILAHYFISGAGAYFNGGAQGLLWEKYDWPDTAYMSSLAGRGMFFEPDSTFSHSAPLVGYFPPLFPIAAALAQKAIGDYELVFKILSVAFWLAAAYLITRDWKGIEFKIAILIIVFFLTAYNEWPPVLNRLREIMAIMLMAFMFKNPLGLGDRKNYLIFGTLLVLAQPLVAVVAIAGYFFFNPKTGDFRIERRMAAPMLALAAIFALAYSGHLAASLNGWKAQNYIGCAYVMPAFMSHDLPRLAIFYLIVAPFFLLFLPTRHLKIAFLAFIAAAAALFAMSGNPGLFIAVTNIVASDMCFQALPVLAFFALFPHKGEAKGNARLALLAIIIAAAIAQVCLSYTFEYSKGYGKLDDPERLFQNGTGIIATRLYLWDAAKQAYLIHFDFRLMSELALKGANATFAYSPIQQFYDPEKYMPDIYGIVGSFGENDLEKCIASKKSLEDRGIGYLSAEIVYDKFDYGWANAKTGWGAGIVENMKDSGFATKCGLEPVLIESTNSSNQNYFIWKFA